MLTNESTANTRPASCSESANALGTLCSATLDSEKLWCSASSIRLPFLADPAREQVVSTLDELLFPFCHEERDVLLTRRKMASSQRDYLRSLGFHFANHVIGEASSPPNRKGGDVQYRYSPYAVLSGWEETVAGWPLANSLPPLDTVRKVNSKIYSWQLRREITGALGEACFGSKEVGTAAGTILDQGRKALVKEAYGVSGRGSLLVDNRKALERICKHIERGERGGGTAEFVVEPLMRKTEDFSCHFYLNEDGAMARFGVQRMANRGFSFAKVESAGESLLDRLDQSAYFRVVEQVGKALFDEGYFGPVCLDSMFTDDGLVAIVEINARKSMGLINLRLHAQLGKPSRRSILSYHDLRVPSTFSHSALLDRLQSRRLLFAGARGVGVVLLNAHGITANVNAAQPLRSTSVAPIAEPSGPLGAVGRIYFSMMADSAEEENAMEQGLTATLREIGLTVSG